MPRRSDGSYERPAGTPYVAGTDMEAAPFNNEMQDLATALGEMIAVDGSTPAEARIPFRQGVSTKLINKTAAATEVSFSGKLHTRGKILSFGRNGTHRAFILLPRGAARDTTPALQLPDTGGELQVGGGGTIPSGVSLLWGTAPPAGWTIQAVDSGGLMTVVGGDTAGIQGAEAGEYFDNVMAQQYMTEDGAIGVRDHQHRIGLYGNGGIGEVYFTNPTVGTAYSLYIPTADDFPASGPVPDAPAGFTHSHPEAGNVRFDWSRPTTGGRVASYRVQFSDMPSFIGGHTYHVPIPGGGDITTWTTSTGNVPGTFYARLQAINPGGMSDYSASVTIVVGGGGTPETPLPDYASRPQWGFLKMQRHLAPPMPQNVMHAHPLDFRVNYWGFVLAQKD